MPAAPGEVEDPQAAQPKRQLGEFIPPEVLQPIDDIADAIRMKTLDTIAAIKMLREILDPHRDFIEARGAQLDYLVYVIIDFATRK